MGVRGSAAGCNAGCPQLQPGQGEFTKPNTALHRRACEDAEAAVPHLHMADSVLKSLALSVPSPVSQLSLFCLQARHEEAITAVHKIQT